MQLISSALKVASFTVLSRCTGFVRDILMAQYIGTGIIMDALVVAIKIPSFLRRIFAEGAFNSSFVPIFSSLLSVDEQEAKQFIQDVFSFLTIVLVSIVVLFEIFMPYFLPLVVPGFKAESFALAVFFSRITFPFILFISLTALFSGVLNSYDRFNAAASSQIAGNIFIIIVLLIVDMQYVQNGAGVAVAICGSGFVQLLWVFVPARMLGIKVKLVLPKLKSKNMKVFFKRLIPAAFGSGILQINLFIDTIIASLLPAGTVSFLYYADRLHHLPISITGTALGTVLLPLLSKMWRENKVEAAIYNQNRAIEFSMLITLPAMVGLMYLSHPLVSVIFERGKFDAHSAVATAQTLAGFASGLPAYILIKIFNTSFFSRQDTTTPIVVALIGMVVNVVLNFMLIYRYQHLGIAIATSLASWFNAIVLMLLLKKKKFIAFDNSLFHFVVRVIVATIVCLSVLVLLKPYLISYIYSNAGIYFRIGGLSLLILCGLISYFFVVWRFKLLNFREFVGK